MDLPKGCEFAPAPDLDLRLHRLLLADRPSASAEARRGAQAAPRAFDGAGAGGGLDHLSHRGILALVHDPDLWLEQQLRPDRRDTAAEDDRNVPAAGHAAVDLEVFPEPDGI